MRVVSEKAMNLKTISFYYSFPFAKFPSRSMLTLNSRSTCRHVNDC